MSFLTKKATLVVMSMLFAAALAAQQPAAPIAGGVVADVVQVKGVIKSVDYQTRWVVLEGPNGGIHAFRAHKSVTNLDKVKPGDTLTVTYVESIAIVLRKATEPPAAGAATVVTVKPKGLPAASDVMVKEVQVNVTAVDQATRSLTVLSADGSSHTFKVDPSVAAFSSVKVGDQIVVRYTESIGVTVTK